MRGDREEHGGAEKERGDDLFLPPTHVTKHFMRSLKCTNIGQTKIIIPKSQ